MKQNLVSFLVFPLAVFFLFISFVGCVPQADSVTNLQQETAVIPPTPTVVLVSTKIVTPVVMEPATAVPTQTPSSTPLPAPTNTPFSTNTPFPTNTPTPSQTPWPTPVLPELPTPITLLPDSSILAEAWVTDGFAWGVGKNGYLGYWKEGMWVQIGSPTGETLNDVEFISPDNGWAVGENSTMLHWNGTGWISMYSYGERPYYNYILEDVEFAGPFDVWAIGMVDSEGGSGGLILHWQWNGQEWVNMEVNRPFCPCPFTSILMFSETDGWVVGFSDVSAFTMHWDGISWNVVPNPYDDYPGSWLYTVSGAEPNDILAEGLKQVRGSFSYEPLVLHWDGEMWQER